MTVDEMKNFCNELGLEKVTVRGENIMFCCPYHGERNPSCGIHAEKEVGGCFACGAKFNLVSLVAFVKDVSIMDAYEFLNSYFNKDFRRAVSRHRNLYGESDEIKESVLSMSALAPFKSGEIVHPYLLKRGFSEEDFVKFKLGWDSELKRITIPFFDYSGNLLGFSSRAVLSEKDKGYNSIYGNESKYKIYNHFNAKDYFYPMNLFEPKDEIILVEGLLDAIWLYRFGYTNTLSIISAQISKTQIEKLKMFKADKIILALDNDKAGEDGCKRIYKYLKNDFTFMRCRFPDGKKDVQDCNENELKVMFSNLEIYPKRNYSLYE